MVFIVNGETYKSQRDYFYIMNPDKQSVKQSDIDNFLYHNVHEYHEMKSVYYHLKKTENKEKTKFEDILNL